MKAATISVLLFLNSSNLSSEEIPIRSPAQGEYCPSWWLSCWAGNVVVLSWTRFPNQFSVNLIRCALAVSHCEPPMPWKTQCARSALQISRREGKFRILLELDFFLTASPHLKYPLSSCSPAELDSVSFKRFNSSIHLVNVY